MNSRFHKAQAEALIKEANQMRAGGLSEYTMNRIEILLDLAQVHATLATVPDEKDYAEEAKLGPT